MTQNIIAEKNTYFKNLVAKYDNIPGIIKIIAEVGAENIFYIGQNYKGLYEDDFCDFTYFNNITGEFIHNSWTTSFACPPFDLYTDNIITIDKAFEMGLVNKDVVTKHNVDVQRTIISRLTEDYNTRAIIAKYTPIIKVSGGRKWKGTGYLVDVIEDTTAFGPIVNAKVLSTDDFQIHYCTYKYVEFVELKNIIDAYKKYADDVFEKYSDRLEWLFTDTNNKIGWQVNTNYLMSFEDFVKANAPHVDYLINTAYDAEEAERKRKLAEVRAKELPNIIEWVKNNTDKTTDKDIMALALKILAKKY